MAVPAAGAEGLAETSSDGPLSPAALTAVTW
jgi:hypothetical protein